MRTNKRTCPEFEVIPQTSLEPLDLVAIFGRAAPLEVDLGCGDGTFLAALAARNPERNFLGVDRMLGRVRGASRNIGHAPLTNARVVQFEILHAVQQLLARESVDVFHLLFPDPWPKRRHQSRRVVTVEFLRAIARALKLEGELRIATDQGDYFSSMQEVVEQTRPLLEVAMAKESEVPGTTFEGRFREEGAQIYRLVLRKTSLPK
jgi:tRNA (guanine-N7-)-methyltransferase